MVQAVAVFGAGVSGIAVASLAKKEGYKVDLFDERVKGCRSDFDEGQLDSYAHFIFSPGFSQSHPWRKWTEGRSNVYGELGFSAQRWRGKLIGGDWY
ncbi:MAG: NAD(P)-binding protein [Coraliomargaritaceae bacterium]